ncbi:hypothetical protein RIF29_28783 [Crotalaria pallida]|uniref:Uncharacterized protein n=1 Tax=Crotalaria pallida TaxID=3830 RepID=A0AAN9EDE8_CROPI
MVGSNLAELASKSRKRRALDTTSAPPTRAITSTFLLLLQTLGLWLLFHWLITVEELLSLTAGKEKLLSALEKMEVKALKHKRVASRQTCLRKKRKAKATNNNKGKASTNSTPSSSTRARENEEHIYPIKKVSSLDFSAVDEENLVRLDALSAKETENLLRNLDVIKERIKGKPMILAPWTVQEEGSSDSASNNKLPADHDICHWHQVTTRKRAQQRMDKEKRSEVSHPTPNGYNLRMEYKRT